MLLSSHFSPLQEILGFNEIKAKLIETACNGCCPIVRSQVVHHCFVPYSFSNENAWTSHVERGLAYVCKKGYLTTGVALQQKYLTHFRKATYWTERFGLLPEKSKLSCPIASWSPGSPEPAYCAEFDTLQSTLDCPAWFEQRDREAEWTVAKGYYLTPKAKDLVLEKTHLKLTHLPPFVKFSDETAEFDLNSLMHSYIVNDLFLYLTHATPPGPLRAAKAVTLFDDPLNDDSSPDEVFAENWHEGWRPTHNPFETREWGFPDAFIVDEHGNPNHAIVVLHDFDRAMNLSAALNKSAIDKCRYEYRKALVAFHFACKKSGISYSIH